jgi:hypothetical protein
MKIALIRREYITHLDSVNRFIALLAEGPHQAGPRADHSKLVLVRYPARDATEEVQRDPWARRRDTNLHAKWLAV